VSRRRCKTCEWWYNSQRELPFWFYGKDGLSGSTGVCNALPPSGLQDPVEKTAKHGGVRITSERYFCSLWAVRDGEQAPTQRMLQTPSGKFVVALYEDGRGILYAVHQEAGYLDPLETLGSAGPVELRIGHDGKPEIIVNPKEEES